MKILHSADTHFHRAAKEQALASLRVLRDTGRKEDVDLFVLAGDLFDKGVQNTSSSGLPELVQVIKEMLDIAPIVTVYGTITHDIPGCYEIFKEIESWYRFMILQPGEEYFLDGRKRLRNCNLLEVDKGKKFEKKLLILGCPEPTKEFLLAGKPPMGKAESDEAIKEGMKEILLGCGALRKENSDIPCLFVYHGNVTGATLQNGQILKPGAIEIGRDDLSLVGATYYALGHIHLAQQIGTLPAYYPGSAYPVNWGEVDQTGFNLVEFGSVPDLIPMVDRIPFPHPPRKKIVSTFESFEITAHDLTGYDVWLQIRVTKEEQRLIDTDAIFQGLIEAGAGDGSRVTTEIIPTETVRAGDIQGAQHLDEKVRIWAENSGQGFKDDKIKTIGRAKSIIAKCAQLETEAERAGLTREGLHIRIRKLLLRGAIGIMKGQGKEEIEVDLDHYDSGLVALLGPNGAGKTTLIENMHPYSTLLTRPGKLQDHFCLRDSYRDLYFSDLRTGDNYRAFIQVDGQNVTGKAEYHLYKNNTPITNGKREDAAE